ncbi:MAG: 50S ribosomal protein L23 [Mycoplasmataceae bacterium]|jgi:large subunit ribosomal protein L23|nr:50S ribosomal protein L23 [Mycoplasmataceae bacterium]
MELTQVIIKPYQTEKSAQARGNKNPVYTFLVDKKADKNTISLAFQTIYGHKPLKVSTQVRKPVAVRSGTAHPGVSSLYKLAYVILPAGVKLEANADGPSQEQTAALEQAADLEAKIVEADNTTAEQENEVEGSVEEENK